MTRAIVLCLGALGLAFVARAALLYQGVDPLAFGLVIAIAVGLALGIVELTLRSTRVAALARALSGLPKDVDDDTIKAAPEPLRSMLDAKVAGAPAGTGSAVFTPYLLGLLVMIGLLGTFMGLFETLRGAREALTASGDVAALRDGLAAPMKGLSRAFGTSAAGVSASAVLGLGAVFVRRAESRFTAAFQAFVARSLFPLTAAGRQLAALEALAENREALPKAARAIEQVSKRLSALEKQLAAQQLEANERTVSALRDAATAIGGDVKSGLGAVREDLGKSVADLRSDLGAGIMHVRGDLGAGITHVRGDLGAGIAHVRTDFAGGVEQLRGDLGAGIERIHADVARGADRIHGDLTAGADAVRTELKTGAEQLRLDFQVGADSLREELKTGAEQLRLDFRTGAERLREELHTGTEGVRADLKSGAVDVRGALESGVAGVRSDVQTGLSDLRADMQTGVAEVRKDVQTGVEGVRTDLKSGTASVRQDLARGVEGVRADLASGVEGVRADLTSGVEGVRSDLATSVEGVRAQVSSGVEGVRADLTSGVDGVRREVQSGAASIREDVKAGVDRASDAIQPMLEQTITRAGEVARGELAAAGRSIAERLDRAEAVVARHFETLEAGVLARASATEERVGASVGRWVARMDEDARARREADDAHLTTVRDTAAESLGAIRSTAEKTLGAIDGIARDVDARLERVAASVEGAATQADARDKARLDVIAEAAGRIGAEVERFTALLDAHAEHATALDTARATASARTLGAIDEKLEAHLATLGERLAGPLADAAKATQAGPAAVVELVNAERARLGERERSDKARDERFDALLARIDDVSTALVLRAEEQAATVVALEARLDRERSDVAAALADRLAAHGEAVGKSLEQAALVVRETADVVQKGGSEMGGVAEMFAGAVDRYRDASELWLDKLSAIDASLAKSGTGDAADMLGAYLDQTREVFDHSLAFQRELFSELRALQTRGRG